MASVGILTGSGIHALPGLRDAEPEGVATPWGACEATRARLGDTPVVHISRHGSGHARLSNHVEHRANVWALRELEVCAVIGCTACGAVDPSLDLGSLVVFDDLHFPVNRLPDGTLCTFFLEAGAPERAHWILHGGPFSESLRQAVLAGARAASLEAREGGVYGHVDGPRFNTPAEIAALRAIGVAAVSQTGGPETVLCGELALPYALVGFVTDYANEVRPGEPTPVETLTALMSSSGASFGAMLEGAVARAAAGEMRPAGTVFRIGGS